jgi:Na+-translocating ferredoxin:NAD+ oxidoreductase RnfC subunit
MKVYSFPHGGILYEDPTAPSGRESSLAFLPQIAIIPLAHYSGRPAAPVLDVGDTVKEGQLLA